MTMDGGQNTDPLPVRTFYNSDSGSSNSRVAISSSSGLKKDVFKTLEAQKFLVYDLNFENSQKRITREWTVHHTSHYG